MHNSNITAAQFTILTAIFRGYFGGYSFDVSGASDQDLCHLDDQGLIQADPNAPHNHVRPTDKATENFTLVHPDLDHFEPRQADECQLIGGWVL